MTRENKLALVVGFGLILLVGILVSDHFSTARTQRAAELTGAQDPLHQPRWEDPDLIALGPVTPVRQPSPEELPNDRLIDEIPSRGGNVLDPIANEPPRGIEMGASPDRRIGLDPRQAAQLPYRFHDVKSGESLSSICSRYFGDTSLIDELADYNELGDPNSLKIGRRLRIPDATTLVRGGGSTPGNGQGSNPGGSATATAANRNHAAARASAVRTYTVKEDDNLSKIAKNLLGSGGRYLAIYEYNRDVLSSPDSLRPGMVLKIPKRTD